MNNQTPEPLDCKGNPDGLAVNSIFYTLQGEGPFAGRPAVFIRLAGCNLQCPLCDTEYTKRTRMTVFQIREAVSRAVHDNHVGLPIVVITGGEPYRQNLGGIVNSLLNASYIVQIETNGTLYQSLPYANSKLQIVCSPKTATVNPKLASVACAWKYVATAASLSKFDGLPVRALEHPTAGSLYRHPNVLSTNVYLQPVDEQDVTRNKANLDAVVASCLTHGYRLCIQLHKIAEVP